MTPTKPGIYDNTKTMMREYWVNDPSRGLVILCSHAKDIFDPWVGNPWGHYPDIS